MNPQTLSYQRLRQLIGWLAFAISIGCVLGGLIFGNHHVMNSISAYYYTNMKDYLEGILALVGAFLLTYYGYDKLDRVVASISGASAIGVALFPTARDITNIGIFNLPSAISDKFHVISASLLFLSIAFMSGFLFTKTGGKSLTPMKIARNTIYISCSIIIMVCIAIFVLCGLINPTWTASSYIILILETIMLFSFGVSWLVKGEVILKDTDI
jgi:hypothetical protein